jgi:hypothetical protein
MALLYCSLVSRLLLSTIVGIECTTDARVPCCQGRVHRLGCVCSYRQVVHIHAAYARAAACTLRVVVCELGYITCAALFRFACAAGSDLLCTVRITVHHVVGSVWGSRLNAESGEGSLLEHWSSVCASWGKSATDVLPCRATWWTFLWTQVGNIRDA